ncbi:HNH endonuclease [Thermoproteota archaeon]
MAKIRYNKSGYKVYADSGTLVHRHVAERKMGGKVREGHEVHHQNGDKTDNRRANLTVLPRSTHRRIHKKSRSW